MKELLLKIRALLSRLMAGGQGGPLAAASAVALSILEEELTDYALKYARLDEYGRRAVQAVIREEVDRCRAQDALAPARNYRVSVNIRRDSVLK